MRVVIRVAVMVLLVGVVLFSAFTAGFGLNYYQVQTQPPGSILRQDSRTASPDARRDSRHAGESG